MSDVFGQMVNALTPEQKERFERRSCGRQRPRRPLTTRPRKSLHRDMLVALLNGPLTARELIALGESKRSGSNRMYELRSSGLAVEVFTLTPEGKAEAERILRREKAWQGYCDGEESDE